MSSDASSQAVNKDSVIAFHDQRLADPAWPLKREGEDSRQRGDVWRWISENHRNNCLLWDEEDLARRTRVSDAEIAINKRHIDGYNQARNDATERVDEFLLIALGLVNADSARPVHRSARPRQGLD